MSYKYKNKSGQSLMIPGVGVVAADGEINSATPLENANLELVEQTQTNNVVATEAPQPNAVIQAQPVNNTQATGEVK